MICRECKEDKDIKQFRKQKGGYDKLCKKCYNSLYHGTQLKNEGRIEDLSEEIWIVIEDAPFYMISSFRRIKSIIREAKTKSGVRAIYEKLIKKRVNKRTGYWVTGLTVDTGNQKTFLVHRLVGKAFIPNPNNYPQINHKDLDRLNDAIDNLEWCTGAQNKSHAIDNGRYQSRKGVKINYPKQRK